MSLGAIAGARDWSRHFDSDQWLANKKLIISHGVFSLISIKSGRQKVGYWPMDFFRAVSRLPVLAFYEATIGPACNHIQLVNLSTGKVLDASTQAVTATHI